VGGLEGVILGVQGPLAPGRHALVVLLLQALKMPMKAAFTMAPDRRVPAPGGAQAPAAGNPQVTAARRQ
jgi:hypothetical protein